MQTIKPSNGGVVLEVGPTEYLAPDEFQRPRVGYVVRVGGGVPWLKPRQAVIYDPLKAMRHTDWECLVRQEDILAVIDGVLRAECPNRCNESPGSGCSSCPREKEERVYPEVR